jgi:hypothetical protein
MLDSAIVLSILQLINGAPAGRVDRTAMGL